MLNAVAARLDTLGAAGIYGPTAANRHFFGG